MAGLSGCLFFWLVDVFGENWNLEMREVGRDGEGGGCRGLMRHEGCKERMFYER